MKKILFTYGGIAIFFFLALFGVAWVQFFEGGPRISISELHQKLEERVASYNADKPANERVALRRLSLGRTDAKMLDLFREYGVSYRNAAVRVSVAAGPNRVGDSFPVMAAWVVADTGWARGAQRPANFENSLYAYEFASEALLDILLGEDGARGAKRCISARVGAIRRGFPPVLFKTRSLHRRRSAVANMRNGWRDDDVDPAEVAKFPLAVLFYLDTYRLETQIRLTPARSKRGDGNLVRVDLSPDRPLQPVRGPIPMGTIEARPDGGAEME